MWLIGAMVCLLAAPWVQFHNALRHHWLMPISCHFRDCKAMVVSLTHVSGAITSVQTFTFCRNGTGCLSDAVWTYKTMATLMFKSLHGCAPSYLSDACKSPPEASRRLRSSGAITCVIPWSRTRPGDRSFDVAGPRLWNKLPASLRSSDSLCQFRRQLKTFLFVNN